MLIYYLILLIDHENNLYYFLIKWYYLSEIKYGTDFFRLQKIYITLVRNPDHDWMILVGIEFREVVFLYSL